MLLFLLELDEEIGIKELEKIAQELIPQGRSCDWHNALMDYGAVHLTARKTKIKSLGRQSKFEGSDRQVRGWILKQLTGKRAESLTLDQVLIEFPQKNIKQIVEGMVLQLLLFFACDPASSQLYKASVIQPGMAHEMFLNLRNRLHNWLVTLHWMN